MDVGESPLPRLLRPTGRGAGVSARVAVAVSQQRDRVPNRDEQRDGLDHNLVSFLQAVGALAFPVPNNFSEEELARWLAHSRPAAIVLSGGNDIGEVPARDL